MVKNAKKSRIIMTMATLNFTQVEEEITPVSIQEVDRFHSSFSFENLKIEVALVLLFTIFIAIDRIKKLKKKEKFIIDGPSHLPVIGMLHHVAYPDADIFGIITRWHGKYGKMFKANFLFQKFYFLCDPDYIQQILSSNDPGHLSKPKMIYDKIAGNIISNGVGFSDYPMWKEHRKILHRAFTFNGIQYQLKKVNHHTQSMINDLLHPTESSLYGPRIKTIFKMVNFAAFEFTFDAIMGLDTTTLEERLELHETMTRSRCASFQRFRKPWLQADIAWWLHPARKIQDEAQAKIRSFVVEIMNRFRTKRGNKMSEKEKNIEVEDDSGVRPFKCMMEEMIDAGLSDQEIFEECLTMFFVGHETTSYSVVYLLLRLAVNPEHQDMCRKEVDQLFERKILNQENPNGPMELTMADLNELEYLDRCLKENLRLIPIVPMFLRRLDTPLKLEENVVLKPGISVGISPWSIHRNPRIYPDPEKFDPGRFLPEECSKRHPYAYLPFSSGSRNCIGWKLAPFSIKLMTALFLRHFELHSEDKWEQLEFRFDVSVTTKKEINLSFKLRSDLKT